MLIRSRWRSPWDRRRGALLSCAILLVTALVGAHADSAAALGEQCSGNNISGLGSSLQSGAQAVWTGSKERGFNGSKDATACSGTQGSKGKPAVSHVGIGSGTALNGWGAYDGVLHEKGARFIGTDEPPAGPVEEEGTQLQLMKSALGSDLVVVPVAQTAIAIVARPPVLPAHSGCVVGQLTQTDLERVFAGTMTNWRELATASDPSPGGDCDQAITRIVREEASGTTYQFKHYLDQLEPEALACTGESLRTWTQLQPSAIGGGANLEWPRKADCGEGEGEGPVTTVATVGEGAVAPINYVQEHPGTITYAPLPVAMAHAPELVAEVYNGSSFAEPGFGKEANCSAASYALPAGAAKGIDVDWSQVYGSDPAIGESHESAYPICSLTWDVAPAAPAAVFGNKAGTTLRDYLAYVTAEKGGQQDLHESWFLSPPAEVAEAAAVAVAAIGGEAEEPEEEEEESGSPTVLCRAAPEPEGGTLVCPSGEGFSEKILGQLMPETEAEFKTANGAITCDKGFASGTFNQDGTSAPEGGLFGVQFSSGKGQCSSTISEPKEVPEASVRFDNGTYDASKFVYLGLLAPQGAFVIARSGEEVPRLRLEDEKIGWKCFYQPTFLGGQVINGSPTELILNGSWSYSGGGGEECPSTVTQTSNLALTRAADGGPLYISGK